MPSVPTEYDEWRVKVLALRREPTVNETRALRLFDSGLDTTAIAEWLTRELRRPVSEAMAYNLLGNAQYYRYVGVLPKFKGEPR